MHNKNPLESSNIKRIHFIGIGGISMSGLAEILADKGYIISGSDLKSSSILNKLEKSGIKVFHGHNSENITGTDLVVYTAAVKEDNPELIRARQSGIPAIDRAALLGYIMSNYHNSIAVSGTHGKTTTTSLISMILLEAGLNPTIHVGGEIDAIGGTTRIGCNDYFVAEACEYFESFLKFRPYMAVILNIEFDHADFFRDIDHVRTTFLKFALLVPEEGYLIACADDPNTSAILDKVNCNIVSYGIETMNSMWRAGNISFDSLGCATYTLFHENEAVAEVYLGIPGIHNVSNSLAAIAACRTMGCDLESILKALSKFRGTHRRFELKGISKGIKIVDDYAHHPTEVAATLKAARNCSGSAIWCVFQPHTYTRTKSFMEQFAASFGDADKVLLTDIYAAREADNGEVNSGMLADKINNENSNKAIYMKSFDSTVEYLEKHTSPGDIIITMGAGDIYKVGEMFISRNPPLQT